VFKEIKQKPKFYFWYGGSGFISKVTFYLNGVRGCAFYWYSDTELPFLSVPFLGAFPRKRC
jgi:hypothetical protein